MEHHGPLSGRESRSRGLLSRWQTEMRGRRTQGLGTGKQRIRIMGNFRPITQAKNRAMLQDHTQRCRLPAHSQPLTLALLASHTSPRDRESTPLHSFCDLSTNSHPPLSFLQMNDTTQARYSGDHPLTDSLSRQLSLSQILSLSPTR